MLPLFLCQYSHKSFVWNKNMPEYWFLLPVYFRIRYTGLRNRCTLCLNENLAIGLRKIYTSAKQKVRGNKQMQVHRQIHQLWLQQGLHTIRTKWRRDQPCDTIESKTITWVANCKFFLADECASTKLLVRKSLRFWSCEEKNLRNFAVRKNSYSGIFYITKDGLSQKLSSKSQIMWFWLCQLSSGAFLIYFFMKTTVYWKMWIKEKHR